MSLRPLSLGLLGGLAILAATLADAPAADAPAPITITGPSVSPASLGHTELAALPAVSIKVSFLTEQGTHEASFDEPLLWTVLEKAGAIDPAKHRDQVAETVTIIGRDGCRAVLALGEITPEFENKQVILAERMNGQPLDPEHFRIVVPLDKRGVRSVRDVARLEVAAPPSAAQ